MMEDFCLKTAANIAKKLLEINAIQLSLNEPFTWASGIKSPIYCDNRKTLSYPDVRGLIADSFAAKAQEFRPFDLIAGVATGGIPHGVLVAERMNLPFIYVRSGKKEHGTKKRVEGHFVKGQTCVVIEDLISTGKSSLEAVTALREASLSVKIVLSIFSYQLEEADAAFQNHDVKYASLSDYASLLDFAIKTGTITERELVHIKNWRADPRNWNTRFLHTSVAKASSDGAKDTEGERTKDQ